MRYIIAIRLAAALPLLLLTNSGSGGNQANHNNGTGPAWQLTTVTTQYDTSYTMQHNYSPQDYPPGAQLTSDGGLQFTLPRFNSVSEAKAGETLTRAWKLYPTPHDITASALSFTITVTEDTSVSPVTYFWQTAANNTCAGPPAQMRPIVVAWINGQVQDTDEWWPARETAILPNLVGGGGTTTLSIPLTPDRWTSLYGHLASQSSDLTAGFQKALTKVNTVGVSTGGGCFYGHGVATIGGTAKVKLRAEEVF